MHVTVVFFFFFLHTHTCCHTMVLLAQKVLQGQLHVQTGREVQNTDL